MVQMIGTGRSEMDTNLQKKLVSMLYEKSLLAVRRYEVKDQRDTRPPVVAKVASYI
jgi:hypothetical protein